MEDLASLGATLRNLKSSFGISGAVNQLLQALWSGELTGVCDQFHGLNASNRSILELPNEAENFVLPTQFWGHAQWQNDGETIVQAANQPFDPWAFNADWHNGNFCVSGSRRRGNLPIFRKAMGVRLRKAEVTAFLAKRGIAPDWEVGETGDFETENRTKAPTTDEIAAKMKDMIDGGMTRDQAAKSIREEEGFELVGNEDARRAVSGNLTRGRRPKNARQN